MLRIQREERRRIARELHDRTAHALGVAAQSITLHRLATGSDPQRAEQRLALAEESIREALESVLAFAGELRAPVGAAGLRAALEAYLERASLPGVGLELAVSGPLAGIPDAVADQVFFILREAVHNAVQHARPRRVAVELAVAGGRLRARVHDDGLGFDTEVTAHLGGGRLSMAERTELIGGRLEVRSSAQGTLVELDVPLDAPAAE